MTDHPITPAPELVEQWDSECESDVDAAMYLATQAARWGADQELEACCDFLQELLAPSEWITGLRAARRPKPPSLKEQALQILDVTQKGWGLAEVDLDTIRRALEQLDD